MQAILWPPVISVHSKRIRYTVPKLLIFAPCEKVIIDQNNNVTLIAVMEAFQVRLPQQEIPENAAAPVRWNTLTLWKKEPGDEDTRYEEFVELIGPDGTLLMKAHAIFAITGPAHRHIAEFYGFPIVRTGGQYSLKLFLRPERDGAERTEVATFPLLVEIKPLAKSD